MLQSACSKILSRLGILTAIFSNKELASPGSSDLRSKSGAESARRLPTSTSRRLAERDAPVPLE